MEAVVSASCGDRRWSRYRLLMGTTALVTMSLFGPADAAEGQSAPRDIAQAQQTGFDIPPQSLTDALALFGRQSGMQVSVDAGLVRGKSSPGVTGAMSPEQALNRILAGTGIAYRLTGSNTAMLQLAAGESGNAVMLGPVQVEAEDPGGYRTDRTSSYKHTAPLLDTPQTITVIPQAVIKEQGARNLTEVLRNTPGISFNAGENGFAATTNNFSMRGFDASGHIFIDGSRDSGAYSRDIFNVEQVEVAKGAAADNGRGGAGGYVNLATKTPKANNFVTGDVSGGLDEYDSEARKRGVADVNHVIANGTAVRLNLLAEDSGVPGREIAERTAWGVAPSLTHGLGTDLRLTLAFEHVERDDLPDFGVPGHTVEGMLLYDRVAANASRDTFYGLASDFDETESDAVIGRIEYDISDAVTVNNQTRWARVDRDARYTMPSNYDPVTQLVSTSTQFYDRVNTTVTNLTNVSARFATGSVGHSLSAGVELTREESDSGRTPNSNPGDTNIFDPDPYRAGGVAPMPTQRNSVTVDTAALYVYDTARIAPQWEVTGGMRAEQYYVDIESKTAAGAPTGNLDGYEDSKFTLGGKIGVVYKPAPNGSIYASYGVSALPPGAYLSNPDIARTGDNAFPGFVEGAKGITSHNYEIGAKWNFFGGKLLTSAAVFRTEKTDVPITGRDVGDTADSLKGYGKQIVQGMEITAAGEVLEGWSVFGGLALMDSERKHSAYLDEVRKRASPGDYGTHDRTSGDELAFTPNYTANLWTTYRLTQDFTVGGGLQFVSSSYLGRPDDANRIIPNGVFGKLPSYTVFHAMMSYKLTEHVDLLFRIYNITDEDYAISSNWNGRRAVLGDPRTFMLTTAFRF